MNKNTKKIKRNINTRKNKLFIQRGGEWGSFFFGSIFGAAILKWLESPSRSNQEGGKKYSKKNKKTRKNKR